MAQDMEKVMDMTLDEYIASFKAEKQSSVNTKNESKFKEGRRIKDENEEDDELDQDMDEESRGIWKGPSARTNYIDLDMPAADDDDQLNIDKSAQNDETSLNTKTHQKQKPHAQNQQMQRYQPRFDLRAKITGNPDTSSDVVPNSNSQQWRLMQPNVMSQRPAGMPPLVPQNTFEERRSHQQYQKRNRFQKNRFNNNRNGFFNNNKFGNGNGSGFFNNTNNMFNNGRIQRNNQRNSNQEMLNKNIKAVLDNLNVANGHILQPQVRDLTIECPSDCINLTSNPYPSSFAPTMAETNSFQIAGNHGNVKSGDSLRALLGINDNNCIKTEMMPMLASKFLDFFQNAAQQTTHKPIYDMKIQKEIHEIQKKPLMYKCPGGEVVSSDGTGINCEIIPRASGMSLNHRFA